jgi:hypothetical protein
MHGDRDVRDTAVLTSKHEESESLMKLGSAGARTLTLWACGLLLPCCAAAQAPRPEPAAQATTTQSTTPAAPTTTTPPTGPAPQVAPAELPNFQPGLWEYRRTVLGAQSEKPQVSTVRSCSDPTADIRAKVLALEQKRCQFVPLRKREDHYVSSWTCPTPNGVTRFRDVLTVQGPTRYEDVSEAHSPNRVTQQKIEARRLGDCPSPAAAPAHAPKPPPPQP